MSLEIEDVKNLPLVKRQAMLTCLIIISGADGHQSDSELLQIDFQNKVILGLSDEQIKTRELNPLEVSKVLNKMNQEELMILGVLMGKVAQSDGIMDEKEIEWIYRFLKIGNLDIGAIAMVLIGVKRATA